LEQLDPVTYNKTCRSDLLKATIGFNILIRSQPTTPERNRANARNQDREERAQISPDARWVPHLGEIIEQQNAQVEAQASLSVLQVYLGNLIANN
jgi:hypothetical protein